MKRPLILTVALIVLLAMAAPVGAVRGGSFKSSPLEVTIDTNHFWANAAGDVIVWWVFATNKGRIPLGPVDVCEFELPDTCIDPEPDLQLKSGDANYNGSLDPGETWEYDYRYTIGETDLESDTISRTLKITADDYSVITTLSADTKPLAECTFVDGTLTYDETNPADAMRPCYYAFAKGYWKLTLTLTGDVGNKPLRLSMTMRDGVPGNWCKISDGNGGFLEGSGVAGTKWRAGDPPLELFVEFPQDGVCLQGGAGGETIGVNNPTIFFLAAWGFSEGEIKAEKCDSLIVVNGTITGCGVP